jgi:hypothetical protein
MPASKDFKSPEAAAAFILTESLDEDGMEYENPSLFKYNPERDVMERVSIPELCERKK